MRTLIRAFAALVVLSASASGETRLPVNLTTLADELTATGWTKTPIQNGTRWELVEEDAEGRATIMSVEAVHSGSSVSALQARVESSDATYLDTVPTEFFCLAAGWAFADGTDLTRARNWLGENTDAGDAEKQIGSKKLQFSAGTRWRELLITAAGGEPERPPSIGPAPFVVLNAKTARRGYRRDYSTELPWGSYSRDEERFIAIEIELRNGGPLPAEFEVIWAVIGRDVEGGKSYPVYGERRQIALASSHAVKYVSSEAVIRAQKQRWIYLRQRSHTGEKIVGWALTVRWQNQVLKRVFSSTECDRVSRPSTFWQEVIAEARHLAPPSGTTLDP